MTTSNTIREPKQARSIEKKKRIIEAGIDLICRKGYQNTTTADIAKAANVSTGIVYNYFKDKKDILMAGLDVMTMEMKDPLLNAFHEFTTCDNLIDATDKLLDTFVAFHEQLKTPHQELASVATVYPDVAEWMRHFEIFLIDELANACVEAGLNPPNLNERIHIAYNLVEAYCHERVFYPNETYDYDAVKKATLYCIRSLLTDVD